MYFSLSRASIAKKQISQQAVLEGDKQFTSQLLTKNNFLDYLYGAWTQGIFSGRVQLL